MKAYFPRYFWPPTSESSLDSIVENKSKIEKVPRDVQGEKSEKTKQVRENWSQTMDHKSIPPKRTESGLEGYAVPAGMPHS